MYRGASLFFYKLMFLYSSFLSQKKLNAFQRIMLVICLLVFLTVLYKFRWTGEGSHPMKGVWSPTWMLFGPLLFFGFNALVSGKAPRYYLHLLPFFVACLFYVLTLLMTDFEYRWQSESYVIYHSSSLVISFSLWFYSYKVIRELYAMRSYTPSTDLLVIISALYILVGFLIAMRFLCWGVLKIEMGIDYRLISYFLLSVVSLFVFRHLYLDGRNIRIENEELHSPRYVNSMLNPDVADDYKKKIIECFETTRIFLHPDLSLELLSKNLNIPKKYLPQIFNMHFKVNFYKFVAQYRIEYALSQMRLKEGKFTIESLAYECGFNSKTSFNRYFKEITGVTPREYQDHHLQLTEILKTA